MGRGTDLAEGITIDEGTSEGGVTTRLHFQGDQLIVQKFQNMESILAHVQRMRERNEAKAKSGWGEGMEVGHIPELFYNRIRMIRDPKERTKAKKQFFIENPAFCAWPPYLKR